MMMFDPNHPPQWSRARMIRAGLGASAAIIFASLVLFAALTGSLRQRKVDQKAERAFRDLLQNQAVLESFRRKHGSYPVPAEDDSLPPEFTEYFAGERGGQPFYQEQARLARLDVFAATPYREPLAYYCRGERWLIVSRGPDGVLQMERSVLEEEPAISLIQTLSYDPTNGAESAGDLWVGNVR